jgi:hypothetical protein
VGSYLYQSKDLALGSHIMLKCQRTLVFLHFPLVYGCFEHTGGNYILFSKIMPIFAYRYFTDIDRIMINMSLLEEK